LEVYLANALNHCRFGFSGQDRTPDHCYLK
jgi:hypothetical protein